MLKYFSLTFLTIASIGAEDASNQLLLYRAKTAGNISVLTTTAGRPIDYEESRNTLNKRLLTNEYFLDEMTQLVRSRIPVRRVHPKGTGAFGYFEVTHDVTDVCKADFLKEVGKKTRVGTRFTPGPDKDGADTVRRLKTLAVKFYTDEGNLDLLCLNTPQFAMLDPILFPAFLKKNDKNPATDLTDVNMLWDYITVNPESLYFTTFLFSDFGLPLTYRHMPAYPVHTYQVVNKNDESTFLRFHILPDAGIENMYSEEAATIAASDPDYHTRDLYNTILNGEYPSWTLYIQVLGAGNGSSIDYTIFDTTRDFPVDTYPLRPVGKIVLNENPVNQFAQIEQMAYNPATLVRGILGGPDRMFEARRLAYRDSQYYRLGGNFYNIAVNCPLQKVYTYIRDGPAPVKDNMGDAPNYYPNSFNGPIPSSDNQTVQLIEITEVRTSNFDLLHNFYSNMTSEAKTRLVATIVASVNLTTSFLQERAIELYTEADSDLGQRIQTALQSTSK